MIELSDLTAAIAALIHRETGVFAVDERLGTAVYPAVYVEGRERATCIIAGGRQLLRQVDIRLICQPDRERQAEGARDLTHSLYGVLLPWFSACSRRFAPDALAVGADGCEMTFSLEFCDLPPQRETGEPGPLMETLRLELLKTNEQGE